MSRSGALAYRRSGSRRARPRRGLDSSLDRHHLTIADALDAAFENAGDRAHDAREVDLNPHHGVGLAVAGRVEFHSPARRGSTHWPGERHVAGRLDDGHLLAPAASEPEWPLRPLIQPRAGLKRSSSANLAVENRRRPLRPASDVSEIREHLIDASGDCYAALGSDQAILHPSADLNHARRRSVTPDTGCYVVAAGSVRPERINVRSGIRCETGSASTNLGGA